MAATFTEGAERNKAMGVWGAVAGSGGAAGVLLGGILTDGLGWEWVFWVNVPIATAAAAIAPRVIAESRAHDMARRFDVAGALSVTAGLTILVYALVDAEDAGWGSTQTIGLLALAVGLLAAFVVIENRSQQPLVPFRIFKLRALTAANGIMLIFGAGLFAMFFFVSPVHAAGARVLAPRGGSRLPAALGRHHRLGRRGLAAGHALRACAR